MKNPMDAGFEQDYNAQIAVDQGSLLIVASALSNHPNDSRGRRTHALHHAVCNRHPGGSGI
jgi:hypothetical protein